MPWISAVSRNRRASESRPVRRRSALRTAAAPVTGLLLLLLTGCGVNTDPGATQLAATSATFRASLQCARGTTCSGYFRWRVDPGGAWVDGPATASPPGSDPATVSWTAPGGTLTPATTYDYQYCARTAASSTVLCAGPSDASASDGGVAMGNASRYSTFTTLPSPVTTVSAQQFRDSLGVNVKETYWDTIYGNWGQTLADAHKLGFTHLRVGIYDSSNAGWNARHWGDLKQAVALGFKLNVGLTPNCSYQGTLADPHFQDCFAALRDGVGLAGVESFEWPNEYDVSGDPNWASDLQRWGPQIYALAKSLGSYPVIGPSIVNPASIPSVGDQSSYLDYGNFHDYEGGTSATPAAVFKEAVRMQPIAGAKPDIATEFGYHNVLAPSSQPGTDEGGAAIYILRQFLEHMADGLPRSYVHQLYDLNSSSTDSEARFGLIRSDGSYKPAASAMAAFASMLGTGAPATLSPLNWTVQAGDQTADLRYLDIQAGDGSHDLVLWRTASVWDRTAQRDLTVAPVAMHVLGAFAAWQQGDPIASPALIDKSGPIAVSLGADPVVLHIMPAASASAVRISTGLGTGAPAQTNAVTLASSGFPAPRPTGSAAAVLPNSPHPGTFAKAGATTKRPTATRKQPKRAKKPKAAKRRESTKRIKPAKRRPRRAKRKVTRQARSKERLHAGTRPTPAQRARPARQKKK